MQETLYSVASIFEAYSTQIVYNTPSNPSFASGTWESILLSLQTTGVPAYESRGEILAQNLGIISMPNVAPSPTLAPRVELYVPNVVLQNFHLLEFNALYPTVIVKLIETQIYPCISPFTEIRYVILNRASLKKNLTSKGYLALKMWINYVYGKLKTLNVEQGFVTGYVDNLLEIAKKHSSRCYYIDTDQVWLRILPTNLAVLNETFKIMGFDVDVYPVEFAYFTAKKKYIATVTRDGRKEFLHPGLNGETFLD